MRVSEYAKIGCMRRVRVAYRRRRLAALRAAGDIALADGRRGRRCCCGDRRCGLVVACISSGGERGSQ